MFVHQHMPVPNWYVETKVSPEIIDWLQKSVRVQTQIRTSYCRHLMVPWVKKETGYHKFIRQTQGNQSGAKECLWAILLDKNPLCTGRDQEFLLSTFRAAERVFTLLKEWSIFITSKLSKYEMLDVWDSATCDSIYQTLLFPWATRLPPSTT